MQIIKIKSIKKIPKTDRYDLTVNSTHNFFANGILIHNTSGISANVLCNQAPYKTVKFADFISNCIYKITNLFTRREDYSEIGPMYDNIYSSRTVIKNRYINKDAGDGYYGVDVWAEANKIVAPQLPKGYTA